VLDGVPATIPGEQARAKYATLVEAYPELGSLIVGSEGGGVGVKFSRTLYDRQFQEKISQGNPAKRREMLPLQEIVTNPEVRLGWQKWGKFYDWKVDTMKRLGVTSLNQKEAAGIAAMQKAYVEQLRAQHPAWYLDYADKDDTKWIRRMDGYRAIINSGNRELLNRPDIAGLATYVQARDAVAAQLKKRKAAGKSGNLTARSNADLMATWDAVQARLTETNLMFSDLHGRWLQGDLIPEDSWST
jgi:hypothetical protein